jgi:hypothetical protein
MPVTGSNLSLRVPAQVAAVCGAAPTLRMSVATGSGWER